LTRLRCAPRKPKAHGFAVGRGEGAASGNVRKCPIRRDRIPENARKCPIRHDRLNDAAQLRLDWRNKAIQSQRANRVGDAPNAEMQPDATVAPGAPATKQTH